MARRKYVVGNWKMNGLTAALAEAQAIFDAAKAHPAVDVALCPPFTLIGPMLAAAPGADAALIAIAAAVQAIIDRLPDVAPLSLPLGPSGTTG